MSWDEISSPVPRAGRTKAWSKAMTRLGKMAFWLRLYAWFNAILGVLLSITLLGLVLSWAFFWTARVLHQAASAAERAGRTGSPRSAARALDRFAFHLLIQLGVLVVTGLIFWGVSSAMRSIGPSLMPGIHDLEVLPKLGVLPRF